MKKKVLSLIFSSAILLIIYWRIDVAAMLGVLAGSDVAWLIASLAMVIPLTILTAHRLQRLMPAGSHLPLGEAVGLTLSASVLNMVLPSKMGDVVKGYFMRERGHLSGSMALALVVFEKGWDMVALLMWCSVGLLFLPRENLLFWVLAAVIATGMAFGALILTRRGFATYFFRAALAAGPERIGPKLRALQKGWEEMQHQVLADRTRLFYVVQMSIFIWFLHLLQIWMFIVALRAWVPFLASLGLAPLAILAGLLPLTFAGVGTRDAALIFFFQDYFAAPTGAALGLLCTMRYVMPAVAGIPFFNRYLAYGRGPART